MELQGLEAPSCHAPPPRPSLLERAHPLHVTYTQPHKFDKVYKIDTSRDLPPDWLSVEEYEACRSDPATEQVGGGRGGWLHA